MANHLNEFDRLIKESYESHQEAYDPKQWDALKEELNVVSPGFSGIVKGVLGGTAITTAILAAMMFFVSDDGTHAPTHNDPSSTAFAGGVKDAAMESGSASLDAKTKVLDSTSAEKEGESEKGLFIPMEEGETESMSDTYNKKGQTASGVHVAGSDHGEATRAKTQKSKVKEPLESGTILASMEPPAKDESPGVRTGCAGMTINFSAPKDLADDAKFLWNFGDGYFSNDSDPSHTFSKEGVFDVSLSVTSHATGQISSNVIQAMIEVAEAPSAYFSIDVVSADEIRVSNESYGASHVDWALDGEVWENREEIGINLMDNTRHELSLVAHNLTGCSDTISKTVYISQADNRFPRAYSRSYTSGFSPGAIMDGGDVTDFRVYHPKTGEEVFHATGSKGWLGSDNSGNSLESGNYKWVMVVDREEAVQVYLGEVELR